MICWYVIKTKPKKEKTVLSQLSRIDFELFLPQIEGMVTPKPLFPSYLFIRADLQKVGNHRLVRYTRGVSYVLGDESGPMSVDTEIIDALKNYTRDGSLIKQELLFNVGQNVVVRRGILKDLIGIIERHLPEQKRVQVLFKWWSTSMRARLRYSDLEKAA